MAEKRLIKALRNVLNARENGELAEFAHFIGYDPEDSDELLEEGLNELTDICRGGCENGTCPALTYYCDTTQFFNQFQDNVVEFITDLARETSLEDLISRLNLDYEDVLTSNKYAKNAYSWLYADEMARRIIEKVESGEYDDDDEEDDDETDE